MGTNYYLDYCYCPKCGQPTKRQHLGKASIGWRFMFQLSDEVKNFEDFKKFIDFGTISDEYGEVWSSKSLLDYIEEKQNEQQDEDAIQIGGYDFFEGNFT